MPPAPTPARARSRAGFTLIELLTVMAIIGILAGLTFGIGRSVQQKAAIQQARVEIAVLAQALEAYKRTYGDYPRTAASTTNKASSDTTPSSSDGPGILFNALTGKRGPLTDETIKVSGKVFIELAKFKTQNTNFPDPSATVYTKIENALTDPWGQRYLYSYKPDNGATWKNQSYLLYSIGPDGLDTPTIDGSIDTTSDTNLDNIYANR